MQVTSLDIGELTAQFKKCLENIVNPKKLYVEKNIFLNNNVKPLLNKIRQEKDSENRKKIGAEYNKLNNVLTEIFEAKLKEISELSSVDIDEENYDIELPSVNLTSGKIHPLNAIVNDVVGFFKKFNFNIFIDSEISTTEYNFDVLNVPLNHITRSFRESLYLDNSQTKLLRTQCTASTARYINCNRAREIRVMTFGNVYRNDTEDVTHSMQFKQIDFMWLRDDLSVANLKWFVSELIKYIFGDIQNIRFRISQFYFTEPSLEVDIACWNCQNGCSFCKFTKWIEILGCGMIHSSVIELAKINPKMTGIAAGIGVERIAMLKYGLNNIHDFYKNDFRFLKMF